MTILEMAPDKNDFHPSGIIPATIRNSDMFAMNDAELRQLLGFLGDKDEFVFLDTNRPDRENHTSFLFLDPVDRLVFRQGDDRELYLSGMQEKLSDGFYLAGWIGYEFDPSLAGRIGQASARTIVTGEVLSDLGVFFKPLRYRHETGIHDFPVGPGGGPEAAGYAVANLRPNMNQEEFVTALQKVREYIGAGDTYQVNYTMKLLFDFSGSVEEWYRVLRRNQSVAYGAYLRHGDERILSLSPEMFFRKQGNRVTARPMKGTVGRGRSHEEEELNRRFLKNDLKNRGENVMIVDLLRNDLARLMCGLKDAEVKVESLFDVESYESLLQMTSTITASCAAQESGKIRVTELFKALFPCGSITGAPKIRTMQIINELEKDFRGVYTGAIGYLSPSGDAVFNVPIRTVRLRGSSGEMGIGAGITYDSDPVEEWHESLLKGRFLTHPEPEFFLFETILWRPDGGYWLLEEHLQRLRKSAEFFNFQYDENKIGRRLQQLVVDFDGACMRVRLQLAKDGEIAVSTAAWSVPSTVDLPSINDITVCCGSLPLVDFIPKERIRPDGANGPWRFHKTTRREEYDSWFGEAQREGLFDYLFCDSSGKVTEGCISNIIILQGTNYLTPPVQVGILPGVMREHLLANPKQNLVETPFTVEDARGADAVFVCNSVRGLVQVRLRG